MIPTEQYLAMKGMNEAIEKMNNAPDRSSYLSLLLEAIQKTTEAKEVWRHTVEACRKPKEDLPEATQKLWKSALQVAKDYGKDCDRVLSELEAHKAECLEKKGGF